MLPIETKLGAEDVLIADGHHRYSVSRSYRDEVRETSERTDTAAELTLAFVNELIEEQLSVAAIHRLYANIEVAGWHARWRDRSSSYPSTGPARTLLQRWRWRFLVLFTREASGGCDPNLDASTAYALDGGWLETALADVPLTVSYQHGLDEALAEVDSGRAAAAS